MAGDDDHRHADGGDRDIGVAGEDGGEVVAADRKRGLYEPDHDEESTISAATITSSWP